jgi:DNA polymerase-3 subunit gamma/tau
VAALSSHVRDLIVSKSGGLEALLELPESLKVRYKEQAERCPLQFLYDALNITTQCESGYRASVNPRLHIEFALMRLSFLCRQSTPQPAAAPAAQPAPAVSEPAPEQPRERRTRASRGGAAGLSIKAMMEEKPVEEQAVAAEDKLPEDEVIKARWPELAKLYSEKPRLASMLTSTSLQIESADDSKTVFFKVVNDAQKDWVESKLLHELEGNFRRIMGSMKVYLRVTVTPDDAPEQKKIYMPSDQAKDLMARNEEVKSLVKDLDLDIK